MFVAAMFADDSGRLIARSTDGRAWTTVSVADFDSERAYGQAVAARGATVVAGSDLFHVGDLAISLDAGLTWVGTRSALPFATMVPSVSSMCSDGGLLLTALGTTDIPQLIAAQYLSPTVKVK